MCLCSITEKGTKILTLTIIRQVNPENEIPKMLASKKGSPVGMKAEHVYEESLLKQIGLSGI